jgi:general secretion pathway protein C
MGSADAGLRAVPARMAPWLSEAGTQRRLRWLLATLLLLWICRALVTALWSFVPPAPALPAGLDPVNPALDTEVGASAADVDIEKLVAAHLFGDPDDAALASAAAAAAAEAALAMSEREAATALAGIEEGAPETRLPLVLRGVVAFSEAGLGQAVIEHRNVQDLYEVGDDLPVNGRVRLAKVLPTQVVLDNGGRYERLRLFEDSDAIGVAAGSAQVQRRSAPRDTAAVAREVVEADATDDAARVAAAYREQLYEDPQSLADVVNVTAVRQGGSLLGYRIAPGRAQRDFRALGFRPGDLVTSINGMSLTDPANTVRLYQAMREAREAVFELQRDGSALSLTVDLSGTGVAAAPGEE